MLFRSVLYVLALALTATLYKFVQSRTIRQFALLFCSYALYVSWGAWFAAVLLASTTVNYGIGRWLNKGRSGRVLALGILFNLSLLSTFKYLPDFANASSLPSLRMFMHLALPLGISFWSFQAMSYLFDIYREEEIEPNFLEFALFMAFFPVVISGPICRMVEMLPQFRSEKPTELNAIGEGLGRIATGVLMIQLGKLLGQGILAGDGINSGFDRMTRWSGPDVWCLVFGYGLQLFLDFGGYSHIAIGAARVLGIEVPENFAVPFGSTTASVFWTRWHMSLSFWIRDYVFLPVAMMRRELWWRSSLLVVSMVVFGVWHKATILFVLWGLYHGLLLFAHRQVQAVQRRIGWNPPERLWTAISWVATAALVSLGWILFRAGSLGQAKQMFQAVLSPQAYSAHYLSTGLYLSVLALGIGYAAVIFTQRLIDQCQAEAPEALSTRPALLYAVVRNRWYWIPPLYVLTLFIVTVVTLTQGESAAQFMYRGF